VYFEQHFSLQVLDEFIQRKILKLSPANVSEANELQLDFFERLFEKFSEVFWGFGMEVAEIFN
jgi:ribonucleotide reductase beta subunit family protein with ferritin-like domain